MPNDNVTQWRKWSLNIYNINLTVPTKEHGIRLGKYLLSFGVPVSLLETVLTIKKGQHLELSKMTDKTITDISHLLSDNVHENKK